MKKLIVVLILLFCGALAFFGLHQVPSDTVIVVDAKFRGTKTYLPGEWFFFPEAIIPGSVNIKKFPAQIRFYSKKKFEFPYTSTLDYFKGFKVEVMLKVQFEVGFIVEYIFSEKNLSNLVDAKDTKSLKKEMIQKIEDMISSILGQNLNNTEFSKEKLMESLKKESENLGFSIQFVIITFPLWDDYSYFLKRLTDASQNRGTFGLLGQNKAAGR